MQGRLRSRLILLLFFFVLTKARPRGTLIAAAIMKASPFETFFDSSLLSVSFNVQIVCATLQIKQTNRLQANKSFTLRLRTCKEIRIPESGKYLLVESRFHNTAQGIRNPTRDWNSKSKSHWQRLESSTWNPEFRDCLGFSHIGRNTIFPLTHDLPHLLTFSY